MIFPFTRTRHAGLAAPGWARYAFAVAASLLAWILEIWLNRFFDTPIPPFLTGFAAVIASAAWAGFGAGICATILVTAWSVLLLDSQTNQTAAGVAVRCLLFVGEGALFSFVSGQLRRAMRRAAESENWHRELVQTTSEGILVTDEKSVITYSNPRMAEILATDANDVTGRSLEEFFIPADLSVEKIRFQNRRAGTREQFDRRLRRRDGSEAWVLTCASPLHDGKKQFVGVLSMMTDITERKNAEYALRQSEERFRGLFENVLEGIYQSTPEGRILAANPMLLRMLGLSHEAELNDVNIAKDLYVDSGVRTSLLERLEQDGSFQNVEYQLRRRDGHLITVQENARAVRDEQGRVLYYEGTLTDISERKRIDAQLLQAQKMEALGKLASGIAHDFSNVLTVISGYAHLVLGELAASHPGRSNAELLVASTESAAGLTQQLLSFSSRQTGSQTVTELNEVIRDAVEEISAFLNERTTGSPVELTTSYSAEPLSVQADAGHIRQALISLIANVRDTMGKGLGVRLKTERVSLPAWFCNRYSGIRPGVYAEISVDCGIAGPARPDRSAAEQTGGFGLATVHAIVAQYGGLMVMDRVAAGNFVFRIYLPLADERSESEAGDFESESKRGAPETILLVEYEPLMREISRDILERHGYRVLVAPGPGEAERISQQGNIFDLLITDVIMPHTSGPELARKLRAGNPGLKVLFISGLADQRAEESGIMATDALLQKPFSADSLERKIRQLLDRA